MTRIELTREIKKVTEAIIYEEMADLHYNFRKVDELKAKKAELEKELAKLG